MATSIEGGYLISMGDGPEVVEDGAVVFDGQRITYAGPRQGLYRDELKIDHVVNARGKAILPGFVNTHTHLIGAFIKAFSEDVPGNMDAAGLYKRAVPVAFSVPADDFYWGFMTHAMEMVMTGTTTINNTWPDESHTGQVIQEIGLRAVISEMIVETDITLLNASVMDRPWQPEMVERGLEETIELYENWHGKAEGRITTCVSPGGPGYVSASGIEKCLALAEKLNLRIGVHLAEVPGETEFVMQSYGTRPVELMRDIGIMRPDTITFHGVFLSESDVGIYADTGTKFSHTSFHVAKRGYFPPMSAVYSAGIDVSFGSDWCSNDLWNYLRAGILIPRVDTGNVGMLSGYDVLKMATLGGARGVGLDKEIGSLEVGKKADIILVDVMTPRCQPLCTELLPTNLVYNACGADVTDVFIDGRSIVEGREIKTVDMTSVFAEVQSRADRVWASAAKSWSEI